MRRVFHRDVSDIGEQNRYLLVQSLPSCIVGDAPRHIGEIRRFDGMNEPLRFALCGNKTEPSACNMCIGEPGDILRNRVHSSEIV